MVAVFLFNLHSIQLGLQVKHTEGAINSRLENIFLFIQVIFDFTFELFTFCVIHYGGLLLVVYDVISISYYTTKMEPFTILNNANS